jgi:putative membrane protein
MPSLASLTSGQRVLLAFTTLYMLGFGVHYLRSLNVEFIAYYLVLLFGFAFVFATLERSRFPLHILWGLSIWGLLHMAGGSVPVGESTLYGYKIYPFLVGEGQLYILKMDQVIHAFGFGVATLVAHHLLLTHAWRENASRVWLAVAAVLIGVGLGSLNEVIEFMVVLTVEYNGVGDLYNMGLDLIFNLAGAVIAALVAHPKSTCFS